MDNYEKLVARIADVSGQEVDEINRKVEAKRAKLSGLVSREGAAQIVAAELGVNFEQERLKISELAHGMRKANTTGKIIEVYPVREFNKNGREGKVVNLLIGDDSGNTRTVLWDTNHIALVENGELAKGDVVEISGAGVRNGELHLGSFSEIKKSDEKIENVVEGKTYRTGKLSEAKSGESLGVRAVVVQTFEPRYFEVCPECKKKATDGECATHGKVEAEKRALLNVVLDDGSETIRSVLFGDNIKGLGLSDEEIFSLEKFEARKQDILGMEMNFSGNIRTNSLYGVTEMAIDNVSEVKADELVSQLEKSA